MTSPPDCPSLRIWRAVWPVRFNLWPDPVTDSTRRRASRAVQVRRNMRRVRRESIRRGLSGNLVMITRALSDAHSLSLYSAEARASTVKTVTEGVSDFPCWWELEAGVSVGLHPHAIAPAEVGATLPPVWDVRPVYDMPGLAPYLSKPSHAAACRSNHRRSVPAADLDAAAELYLTARSERRAEGFERLPTRSGFLNVTRLSQRSPGLALRLCAAEVCAVLLALPVLLILHSQARSERLNAEASAQHQARRERLTRLAQRQAARATAPRPRLAPQRRAVPLPRLLGQISAASDLHGLYSAKVQQPRQTGPP